MPERLRAVRVILLVPVVLLPLMAGICYFAGPWLVGQLPTADARIASIAHDYLGYFANNPTGPMPDDLPLGWDYSMEHCWEPLQETMRQNQNQYTLHISHHGYGGTPAYNSTGSPEFVVDIIFPNGRQFSISAYNEIINTCRELTP
ncbi:MAG: hypothetical protein AAF653_20035 [Chloroflexota bacterium]